MWIDPDTGHKFVAANKIELIKYIRNYRSQNDLSEIDYLAMSVDDYLCRLPENVGKCEEIQLKRGFFEYASGGMALLKNVFFGEKNMVDQEEAERRAVICELCPYNSFPDESLEGYDQWANGLAVASTGGKRTSKDKELRNCEVCTCCLKAKIWSKGPFKLDESQISKMKEVGCWQIEGKENVQQ